MKNNKQFWKDNYEIKKERVKEICASVGKEDKEFVEGTTFGILIGMSMMAHKVSNLQIESVNKAMSEFHEMADILHIALTDKKM